MWQLMSLYKINVHCGAPPLICATMMLFFVHLKGCMGSMSCKIFSFIRSSNVRTSKVSQDLQTGQSSAVQCAQTGEQEHAGPCYNRHL